MYTHYRLDQQYSPVAVSDCLHNSEVLESLRHTSLIKQLQRSVLLLCLFLVWLKKQLTTNVLLCPSFNWTAQNKEPWATGTTLVMLKATPGLPKKKLSAFRYLMESIMKTVFSSDLDLGLWKSTFHSQARKIGKKSCYMAMVISSIIHIPQPWRFPSVAPVPLCPAKNLHETEKLIRWSMILDVVCFFLGIYFYAHCDKSSLLGISHVKDFPWLHVWPWSLAPLVVCRNCQQSRPSD